MVWWGGRSYDEPQLLASWCGVLCVKLPRAGGRMLWGSRIRFGPRFFFYAAPKLERTSETVGIGPSAISVGGLQLLVA